MSEKKELIVVVEKLNAIIHSVETQYENSNSPVPDALGCVITFLQVVLARLGEIEFESVMNEENS